MAELFELTIQVTGAEKLARFDPREVSDFMASQAEYVQETWRSAVSGNILPGMARAVNNSNYADSIQIQRLPDGNYQVVCGYPQAERIERGYASYDMKPGLLLSPSAKITSDGLGRYVTVPFRQFTPGPGGGIRVSARETNTLPAQVHLHTKMFGRYGGKEGMRSKLETGPMDAPYTWKAGQFQGLTKTTTAGGASRYFTFRRVSSLRLRQLADGRAIWVGTDSNAFIHPGQLANPVMSAVENQVKPIIESRLHDFLVDKIKGE